MNNPLLTPFVGLHGTAPFASIQLADYKPAFEAALQQARTEIDQITSNSEAPSFENTLEALEYSGQLLDRISNIFFNLNSAETSADMQQLAQELTPMLTAFSNDVSMNEALFERVKTVYNQRASLHLTPEQQLLLEKKFKGFSRNGALLNAAGKSRLREIDRDLAQYKLTFGEHVLAETQAYHLHITQEADLAGLPEGVIEAAADLAKSRELDGWVFTLDYPSYIPFVTYSDQRALRKEITLVNGRKGHQDNDNDNRAVLRNIVQLRHERAHLLGYESHAHFVLEERMAQNPATVQSFLADLCQKAWPAAQREWQQLTAFAQEELGIDQLARWDGPYVNEKLKQKLFQLDDEVLKPYFSLDRVLDGAFLVANRLFGIEFVPAPSIEKYHADVQCFEVIRNHELVAVFYADFFPRPGKRNGAWMTSFKPQYQQAGVNERPHVSIVCNFTPPTPTKPSLLTFQEVTTLFHEFGHALHGMLANTTYPSLSGTSVYWDFVELPSQWMENWCYEEEVLSLFATHYETGERIPQVYIDRIKESANFMEGMATIRQLSFGMLDMAYHAQTPDLADIKAFEKAATADISLYPDVEDACMSTSFSHIFQGGYSSGYYSYKWAEVLDADAFEAFRENGLFNPTTATAFQEHILSKGGTEHPMDLYRRFRGQDPKPDALLKRAGLV
ncbi:MAG: peptidase M3 [Flavobacterium sp. BFFFF2]|nr:MAG: peptidase M3 [Flavobacterium sp. BFFFF2]